MRINQGIGSLPSVIIITTLLVSSDYSAVKCPVGLDLLRRSYASAGLLMNSNLHRFANVCEFFPLDLRVNRKLSEIG